MAVNINITHAWPATLPLPFIDFSGGADVVTLHSPPSSSRIKRRSRQTQTFATVGIKWKFSQTQWLTFIDFWENTLGSGASAFSMELRHPKISTLSTWLVKIVSELNVENTEHTIWEVSARIQIIQLSTVDNKAAELPKCFLVQSEDSSAAAPVEFHVQNETSGGDPVKFIVQPEDPSI